MITSSISGLLDRILLLANYLSITILPDLSSTCRLLAVMINYAASAALYATLDRTERGNFVLAIRRVMLAIFMRATLIMLVRTLRNVFSADRIEGTSVCDLRRVRR